LWGTFGLPSTMVGIVAIDGIIEVYFPGPADVPRSGTSSSVVAMTGPWPTRSLAAPM
jgi:hypothetical protein